MNYDIHRFTELFDELSTQEYQELFNSIKANGLYTPIVLYNGILVSGRARLKACLEICIEPKVMSLPESTTDKDLINFIIGENAVSRGLDTVQYSKKLEEGLDMLISKADPQSIENILAERKKNADNFPTNRQTFQHNRTP